MNDRYFVGVDVGTGSVRAALVASTGKVLKVHVKETKTWNPLPDHYEQSSDNIWNGVCECVKTVTNDYDKHKIAGIGFDATCSLVALDKRNQPLTISTSGENEQNIILWMDHRAINEANQINATKHELLKCVGGKVHVEMEIPKVKWLKSNFSTAWWSKVGKLMELPDFLTFKCTGDDTRSLCSIVCKWNYDGFNGTWSMGFFQQLGLNELCADSFAMIGKKIAAPGAAIGAGLNEMAAEQLNLVVGTPVAVSMIDAHAGALGMIGCHADGIMADISSKMAVICGTSSCHMSVEKELIWANGNNAMNSWNFTHMYSEETGGLFFFSGIYGPYKNALLLGYYLHEGGQSSTGYLLDHIVKNHPAYNQALERAGKMHIFAYLNEKLEKMANDQHLSDVDFLTKDFHVWPDLHGNRSPLADSTIKGMICGLTLSTTIDNLAITYLGFVQALSYGTKHILDQLLNSGRTSFHSLLMCGGLRKNPLFVRTHAEACNLPVLVPNESETMLVGAAMLGACAANVFPTLESASTGMASKCDVIHPNSAVRCYHERKYNVFRQLIEDQMKYKQMMQ